MGGKHGRFLAVVHFVYFVLADSDFGAGVVSVGVAGDVAVPRGGNRAARSFWIVDGNGYAAGAVAARAERELKWNFLARGGN